MATADEKREAKEAGFTEDWDWEECAWAGLNENCHTSVDPKGITDLCWEHEQQKQEEDAADTAYKQAKEQR